MLGKNGLERRTIADIDIVTLLELLSGNLTYSLQTLWRADNDIV
jgi:hypothetical protein